jgi:hypothetical protein
MLPKEDRAMRKLSPRIPDALPKTLLKKRLATVRLEDLSSSGGTVECSVICSAPVAEIVVGYR